MADPIHHVLDEYICGVDTTGAFVWLFRTPVPGFKAMQFGPFDLIFTKHMFGVTLSAVLVFLFMTIVSKKARASVENAHAPRGRFVNFFESLVMYVRNEMVMPNMGHHGVRYIPVFLTFFFFILFCNLLGMVPELGAATGNINITATLAVIVFLMIFVFGSIEQGGPHTFLINLVPHGVPWWLWLPMLLIELIGPVAKCFALAMRLFANMVAGHVILAVILGLAFLLNSVAIGFAGALAAVAFSFLEIFVAFLQAYIFTLLSIIFIGAAVHPDH